MLKEKTDEVRRAFALPETETVIQDYHCRKAVVGRIYVTQNYILWTPSVETIASIAGHEMVAIAYRDIKEIKLDKGLLSAHIIIDMNDGKQHNFTGFVHTDECFNLLHHLWKHPVSYVSLEEEKEQKSESPRSGNDTRTSQQDFLSGEQRYKLSTKIDTESSRSALRTALEAREIGSATLVELSSQAEQIDRIEYNVAKVNANLDTSERLMLSLIHI
eukprot:TRINITY_DN4262_c0_g1_i1.p1 TRINITY_DN4262_c0_g1~~TRINITY_DN4262_c0_g1_i1.p1  ORF type:complete len:245 (-),score=52.53 TRINITY_DN4262_c0_g1_i1:28-678(-)